METNIIFATSVAPVNAETLNTVENAVQNGLTIVYNLPCNDRKRARRAIYDLCRMLRGEIATGKNMAAVPAEIRIATAGVKITKQNANFGTNKTKTATHPIIDDGILSIDLGEKYAYCWRATETAIETATETATETTIETATETAIETATETAIETAIETAKYMAANAVNRRLLDTAGISFATIGKRLIITGDVPADFARKHKKSIKNA